ncbi:hypothetical protein A5905_07990 [Prescottella equi]|nr:hypothetical protein A5905_07990 [Prescottella equi]
MRRSHHTQTAKPTSATATHVIVRPSVSPHSLPRDSPTMMTNMLAASSTAPSQSMRACDRIGVSGTRKNVSSAPIAQKPNANQNTDRTPRWSMSTPATSSAPTPTAPTPVFAMLIEMGCNRAGNVSRMSVYPKARQAKPAPDRKRPATSTGKVGAVAEIRAPSAPIAAVTTSIFFLPYRSASLPMMGDATAPDSVKAVITHTTCVVWNSAATLGSVGANSENPSADCSVSSSRIRRVRTQYRVGRSIVSVDAGPTRCSSGPSLVRKDMETSLE